MAGSLTLRTAIVAMFAVLALPTATLAKPQCPGHPSCKDDDGGGGEPPAVISPTIAYSANMLTSNGGDAGGAHLALMDDLDQTSVNLLLGSAAKGRKGVGVRHEAPTWAPDGEHIAYRRGDTTFRVSSIETDPTQHTIFQGQTEGRLAWRHHADEWLAYSDGNNIHITRPYVEYGPGIPLTENADATKLVFERDPDWSPDGSHLAFTRETTFNDGTPGYHELIVCDLVVVGETPECIAEHVAYHGVFVGSPTWHPTQDLIAFKNGEDRGLSVVIEAFVAGQPFSGTDCIQLRSERLGATGFQCNTWLNVKDFYFGHFSGNGNFDWSCDGESLFATGNRDKTGKWGLHRIDDVFVSQSEATIDVVPLLVNSERLEFGTWSGQDPAARITPNCDF